jgi:hypothetical protein
VIFEVPTVVIIKPIIFLDITLYTSVYFSVSEKPAACIFMAEDRAAGEKLLVI